jgi:hypothetical protein
MIDTGDTVLHKPSGETWVVAAIEDDGEHFYACGWPETRALLSDCELVSQTTGELRRALLESLAKYSCSGESASSRANWARRNLLALDAGNGAPNP